MSDVILGIPPETLMSRASEYPVLPDLYLPFYHTQLRLLLQDMSEVIVRRRLFSLAVSEML